MLRHTGCTITLTTFWDKILIYFFCLVSSFFCSLSLRICRYYLMKDCAPLKQNPLFDKEQISAVNIAKQTVNILVRQLILNLFFGDEQILAVRRTFDAEPII